MRRNVAATWPHNVEGFRAAAQRRLPRAVFDFVDGAAEDELTALANTAAFERTPLVPRVACSAGPVDLSTTLCGQPLTMPLLLAPTGLAGLVHPGGEHAAAMAATAQVLPDCNLPKRAWRGWLRCESRLSVNW